MARTRSTEIQSLPALRAESAVMSNLNTPETDSNIVEVGFDKNDNPCHFVSAEFARTLERERDKARAERDMARLETDEAIAEYQRVYRELDALKKMAT